MLSKAGPQPRNADAANSSSKEEGAWLVPAHMPKSCGL